MSQSLIDKVPEAIENRWPKTLPPLTEEQKSIRDDFVRYWHEVLRSKATYGPIESFNHGYVIRHSPSSFLRTLEIGAGLGEHLRYERLSKSQLSNYVPLELRPNMVQQLQAQYPNINAVLGDCQQRTEFPDGYFDRILAIHVLEHLPNLPAAVDEMHRVCNKSGVFSVVIPCEGGLAYSMARRLSAQRVFEQRYKQPYKWFIEQEHINKPDEVINELMKRFKPIHREFFPFLVPSVELNLCIGLTLSPL